MFNRITAKEKNKCQLDKLILEGKTLKSLSPQELLDIYKSEDITALVFALVQEEVCRRLRGEA